MIGHLSIPFVTNNIIFYKYNVSFSSKKLKKKYNYNICIKKIKMPYVSSLCTAKKTYLL